MKGVIVPLYSYPGPSLEYTREKHGEGTHYGIYDWHLAAQMKKQFPQLNLIAIVNPDSGPGSGEDALFTKGIEFLQDAGVIVVGYVSTKYAGMNASIGQAKHPASLVKKDLQKWYSFYPRIDGIFFDEMARGFDPSIIEYYHSLSRIARSRNALIIMNPGTSIDFRWFKRNVADIFITWERDYYPQIEEIFPNEEEQRLVHESGVETGCLVMGNPYNRHTVKWVLKPHFDWIYVTPEPLDPDPWKRIDPQVMQRLCRLQSKPLSRFQSRLRNL